MARVQATIDTIELGGTYVKGSLIIKSSDERGCVLKWLDNNGTTGDRKERFLRTKVVDKNRPVTRRRVLGEINVADPR